MNLSREFGDDSVTGVCERRYEDENYCSVVELPRRIYRSLY
jgi:hypothetical protein